MPLIDPRRPTKRRGRTMNDSPDRPLCWHDPLARLPQRALTFPLRRLLAREHDRTIPANDDLHAPSAERIALVDDAICPADDRADPIASCFERPATSRSRHPLSTWCVFGHWTLTTAD
jgi:hypothetical protein